MPSKRRAEIVSARTLRRHYALLDKVAEKVLSIGYNVRTSLDRHDQHIDRIAELGERLRVIESDIEKMQKYIGRLVR